jgi:hypothetical protein
MRPTQLMSIALVTKQLILAMPSVVVTNNAHLILAKSGWRRGNVLTLKLLSPLECPYKTVCPAQSYRDTMRKKESRTTSTLLRNYFVSTTTTHLKWETTTQFLTQRKSRTKRLRSYEQTGRTHTRLASRTPSATLLKTIQKRKINIVWATKCMPTY